MSQVYAFVTSDQFSQLMQRMEDLTEEVLGLDALEKKTHESLWNKRRLLSRNRRKGFRYYPGSPIKSTVTPWTAVDAAKPDQHRTVLGNHRRAIR